MTDELSKRLANLEREYQLHLCGATGDLWRGHAEAWRKFGQDAADALDERDARIAALEKDARRYRWLREGSEVSENMEDESGHYVCLSLWKGAAVVIYEAGFGAAALDAAIDAALAETERSETGGKP